jgi:hypothetical protein
MEEGKDILPSAVPEERVGLELGDTVVVIGGQLNKTVGKIYGFSTDRLLILPKGATDRVIRVPLIDGEIDPDLEVENILILKKAARAGFVFMIDMRAGQYVETFGPDSKPSGIFKVLSVDEVEDSAVLQDAGGGESEVIFGFSGISPEMPFEVMRTRESEAPVQEASEAEPEEEATQTPVAVEEEDILENGQAPSMDEEPIEFEVGETLTFFVDEELKEITSADRLYDDIYQRSEMLSQLILLLPFTQRRDPVRLQTVRRTVEQFLILRNEVVEYNAVGDPSGTKATSIDTLAELVSRPSVYLARKIANVSKVLYLDHSKKPEDDPGAGPIDDGIYGEYLSDILKRGTTLEAAAEAGAAEAQLETAMPKFFLDMERYRQQIQSPYIIQPSQTATPVEKDEEVFRREVPNFDEPQLNALSKLEESDATNPPPIIQTAYGISRMLAQRSSRFLKGEPLRAVEPAESPSYTNMLVFPRSALRDIGPTRSGILAQDMSLGAMEPTMLEDILKKLGEITDFPTADSILNIGVKGNIVGNVTIKDWLSQLNIPLSGLGDVWEALRGYGADTIEWNAEQVAVIQGKIEQSLAGLRLFMTRQREENKALLANLKFSPEGVLAPEDVARLLARTETEPILKKLLERFREYMGGLAGVDINWFSFLFLTYPDLLLAALGGQPNLVVKERMRAELDLFNNRLMVNYLIAKMKENIIEPVEENPCPHVQALAAVRKAAKTREDEPRDVTKIKLLVKLLGEFRGKTTDEWVDCSVCEKHLICAHELIYIQEFLRPTEQDTLHKELIIKFSGGQFSGRFVCRVCGQSIGELEFDQSLEFDDEGRPMMGRSVMVDRDGLDMDELEDLLKGPGDVLEEVNYGNEALNTMYKVLKKLASGMGVDPEDSDYRRMVEDLSTYISTLPDRKSYGVATAGKKAQDYDVFYSVRYVSAASAILLLNVQTRIPDYIVYYTSTDCKDGFYGYPLEATEGEGNITGIQCVSSVVAGINDNEFPWNMTTLQKTDNLVKRRDFLVPIVRTQITEFVKHPIQQAYLKKKRDYRMKLFGKVGGLKADQISKSFRPVPFILTESEAAEAVVTAEATSTDKQATAWIRTAHRVARDSAALNPDAPLSETTSCLHSLANPYEFWRNQSMPALEARVIGQGARTGVLSTTFYTEMPKGLEGKVDPKDYYKLFANLCWQGDNMGLPHRLGLTLTCAECGLHFKVNPNLPLSLEENPKLAREEAAKGAADLQAHIISQGIIINEDTAQELLNTSRIRMTVSKGVVVPIPRLDEGLLRLAAMYPKPLEGWEEILGGITKTLVELGRGASRIQIATASERLVDEIGKSEAFVLGRLGKDVFRYIESLTLKTPRESGEAISAFILVPFKRWMMNMDVNGFAILNSYKLSPDTQNDIMVKGLGNYLKVVGDGRELSGLLLRKVRGFVGDLTDLCKNILPVLRSIMIPGGDIMTRYLLRAYIMGIVQKFTDPQNIPDASGSGKEEGGGGGAEEAEAGVIDIKVLYKAFAQAMTKYAVGAKVPSEDEIRFALEKRSEKEKQQFIGEMDAMSLDKRKVELTLKSLGMGKWAAGGSKSIRQYDSDRYEVERAERVAAGIADYVPEVEGRATDMFGLDFAGEYEAGGDRMDGDYTEGAMREDEY